MHSLRLLLSFLLLMSFSNSPFAETWVNVVTTEMPPYTGNEQSTTGFLTEIVKSAFSSSGYRANVQNFPWITAKQLIYRGQADAIFPVSFEEADEMNASKVLIYKTPPLVFVSLKDKLTPWNGYVNSIEGYKVGVVRAFSYTQEFDQASQTDKYYLTDHHQLIKMLLKKRIDLALLDRLTANYFIRKNDPHQQIRVLTPSLINSSEFFLAVSKSGVSRDNLREDFARGLKIIEENGQLESILEKYKVADQVDLREEKIELVDLDSSNSPPPKGSGLQSKVKKLNPKDMNIGFVGFHWLTDNYQKEYKRVLEEEAQQLGVNLLVYDSKASIDKQKQWISILLEKQVDVIAVWPVHGKEILPSLEKARDQKVPVLIVNTPVDAAGFGLVSAYAGPNNVQEGRLAAQMMIEALNGKGSIVEIQGFPGYTTAIERSIGFSEEIERQKLKNPDIEIQMVDVISGFWNREKAREAAKRLLRRHKHFDGLYVGDDNMGIGAIEALDEAGRLESVKITSATLFGEGYDAIKAGKIYGSVWQSPARDAKTALNTAIKLIKHEKVDFFNYFDTPRVTMKTIDRFDRPNF